MVSRFVHDHATALVVAHKKSTITPVFNVSSKQHLEKLTPVDNAVIYSKFSFDPKVVGEKTDLEKIYNPNFVKQMQEHYQANVAPQEKLATDPYHHVTPWEQAAYEDQRHQMAVWTARQALNDRINSLLSRADPNSSAMQVMHAVKSLNGEEEAKPKKSEPVAASANGSNPNAIPVATSQAVAQDIPTRVKAKLNVLKGLGQVDFSNPIVMTSLSVDVNSAIHNSTSQTLTASDDPVRLDMKREFKAINLSSGIQYGFEKQIASFNLTQKVTDHISCVASSDQYTGEQRNADGSKGQQVLRMNYSLSF